MKNYLNSSIKTTLCATRLFYPMLFAFGVLLLANLAITAATFTVTKTSDTNDGVCDTDCSLREAVVVANMTPTPDNSILFDSAVFGTPRTITLSSGSLTILSTQNLSIIGTGVGLVSIDCSINSAVVNGNQQTVSRLSIQNLTITGPLNGTSGRVYNSSGSFLNLHNVVIRNSGQSLPGVWNVGTLHAAGSTFTANQGSAVYNDRDARTTIVDSTISNNWGGVSNDRRGTVDVQSTTISNNTSGSGVFNAAGTVTIAGSTISGNTPSSGFNNHGGGIWSYAEGGSDQAVVNVTNSVIRSNRVSGEGSSGGGVACLGSTNLTITNSTISDNQSATSRGGGIYGSCTSVTVTNSTISNNTAGSDGGGIWGLTLNFNSVTINNNRATRGGGVFTENTTPTNISIRNTIMGDNVATGVSPDYFGGFTSLGYNLLETADGVTIAGTTTGNVLRQDPELVPIRNNGGNTQTVALQPSSPAIDGGDPANSPVSDQRGITRPQDGDLDGNFKPDIGAYERQVVSFLVTKTGDSNDGMCDADCSLREALSAIASAPPTILDKAVIFDPAVFFYDQTILLTLGELTVASSAGTVLIKGSGTSQIRISGNNSSRVITVNSNVYAATVFLTIRDGATTGSGGGINNLGTLSLANCLVTANSARGGGGIASFGLTNSLTIKNSRVTENTSTSQYPGGGLYAASSVTITNSSLIGNASNLGGGGIYNDRSIMISDSKISNNSSVTNSGGGILNSSSGSATINRSILSENTAFGNGGAIYGDGGSVTIVASTISGNTARGGGGIDNSGFGTLILINTTISRNRASQEKGGGIFNGTGCTTTLRNSTVAQNFAADSGGGIFNNPGTVNSKNSIIADNSATNASADFSGALTSEGFNIVENTSGTTITGITASNILGQDPRLDPVLRLNGGSTPSHAVRVGSPAIDKGSALTPVLSSDQRLRPRPFDSPAIPNATGGNGSDIGAFERQANDVSGYETPFDFDGDSKTDLSIFRPGLGEWWVNRSTNGGTFVTQFGAGTDVISPADFTGDGKTDVAFWRPSTGGWYILRSEDLTFFSFPFGANGDVPVPADFDGDGKADSAVFRPSSQTWFINKSTGGTQITTFGLTGDVPVNADYDGDGKSDVAIYRPSSAGGSQWWIQRSSDSNVFATQFGQSTDKTVAGDFTGDGKSDIAFWTPTTGNWSVLRSEDLSFFAFPFGTIGDVPSPGDYDGDGKYDAAVFRPSTSTWYANRSTAGVLIQQFGLTGDLPLPNAYVR